MPRKKRKNFSSKNILSKKKHQSGYANKLSPFFSGTARKKDKKKYFFSQFYQNTINPKYIDEDFDILVKRYSYKKEFSRSLEKDAFFLWNNYKKNQNNFENRQAIPEHIDRINLTGETVFTIDGKDAKDFDDAVSIHKEGKFYHLGVHIADVSYFINEASSLDEEASRRGTSVYLIDKVIPMFPETISNHLCSLVEGEPRFTYSCFTKIDESGKVCDYSFKRSIIKSVRQCNYDEVQEVIDKKKSLSKEIDNSLNLLNELRIILKNRRRRLGSISFKSTEKFFQLEAGEVQSVFIKKSLDSENLIEEMMLVTNVCAAEILMESGSGIYRVHDLPNQEKITGFEKVIFQKGFILPEEGSFNPLIEKQEKQKINKYSLFLDSITDEHLKNIFSFMLLTSMSQAQYHTHNIGHYGLGFKNYTHFTSPIRRYPDLTVHRLISEILNRNNQEKLSLQSSKLARKKKNNRLKIIAKNSLEMERKSVDAEREYHKIKIMRYLKNCQDLVFESIVVKIMTDGGMFVQVKESGIEGFIENYYLEQDLYYDSEKIALTRKKQIIYEIGSKIDVKLDSLNFKKLFINFKPIN